MLHIILIPLGAAIFLSVNMGGSGVASAFSAAYGANLIRKDLIPGLFGAFVLLGALFSGEKVVNTLGSGIVRESHFSITLTTIMLISVGIAIMLANMLKVPQSTSQAAVFSLMGIGAGLRDVNVNRLVFHIFPAWIYLPVLAFFMTFLAGRFIYKPIKEREMVDFPSISAHPLIRWGVIASSCYVSYAIGANNVANASGPVYSMLFNKMGLADSSILITILSVLMIAPWFGIGGSIFSSRVLEPTGKEIIEFGPLGSLSISLVTASLLLYVSLAGGIPAALAQLNIGAILGLGVYKEGFKKLFTKQKVKRIFLVWIISPCIAFVISYFLMKLVHAG